MQTTETRCKWTFISNYINANPGTTYPQAEKLYHLKIGFSPEAADRFHDAHEREVTRLKTLIDTGAYQPDSAEVADSLIQHATWNERVKSHRLAVYERRREEFQKQATVIPQEVGMAAALPPDPADDGQGNYFDDWPDFDWKAFGEKALIVAASIAFVRYFTWLFGAIMEKQ